MEEKSKLVSNAAELAKCEVYVAMLVNAKVDIINSVPIDFKRWDSSYAYRKEMTAQISSKLSEQGVVLPISTYLRTGIEGKWKEGDTKLMTSANLDLFEKVCGIVESSSRKYGVKLRGICLDRWNIVINDANGPWILQVGVMKDCSTNVMLIGYGRHGDMTFYETTHDTLTDGWEALLSENIDVKLGYYFK